MTIVIKAEIKAGRGYLLEEVNKPSKKNILFPLVFLTNRMRSAALATSAVCFCFPLDLTHVLNGFY